MLLLEKWAVVFIPCSAYFFLPSTPTPSQGEKKCSTSIFFHWVYSKLWEPKGPQSCFIVQELQALSLEDRGSRTACLASHNGFKPFKGHKLKSLQGVGKWHKLEKGTGYAKNGIQLGGTIGSAEDYGKLENSFPFQGGNCYSALAMCCHVGGNTDYHSFQFFIRNTKIQICVLNLPIFKCCLKCS